MTVELDPWQTRNAEYLGAALASLRQRLQAAARITGSLTASSQVASQDAPARAAEFGPRPPNVTERSAMAFFRRKTVPEVGTAGAILLLPSTPTVAIETPPDDVAHRLAAASEGDPPPALLMLAKRLGLSDFERDILLLCVALELDTGTATLCAAVQGQPDRDHATFALAMKLFDRPEWQAVSPERPLRYWRLIEINQPGARPLTASALRADERIVNYVKGLNHLDDRLSPLVLPMSMATAEEQLPPSQQAAVQALSQGLRKATTAPSQRVVVALRGRDRQSKREVAVAAATMLGLQLYRLPADELPAQTTELEALARLWFRETLLLPLALYIDAHESDKAGGSDSLAQRLSRFVARTGGLVFVDSRDGVDLTLDPLIVLDIAKPTTVEQRQAWTDAIAQRAPTLPAPSPSKKC